MAKEPKSKKKGCLTGCLLVLVIIIVLVAVLAVFGYLNRHRILPFVTDKLDLEISSVIQYAGGTEAETGMPAEFLDNAYKIDLPQGNKTAKVTTSDTPADQTYDIFIQYFKEEGWEVKKEMEAQEVASEEVESVSKYMEEELRVAELARDGRRMNLGVTRYNDETVAAVWYTPGSDSEPEKIDDDNDAPADR